jgi:hypothetical protein
LKEPAILRRSAEEGADAVKEPAQETLWFLGGADRRALLGLAGFPRAGLRSGGLLPAARAFLTRGSGAGRGARLGLAGFPRAGLRSGGLLSAARASGATSCRASGRTACPGARLTSGGRASGASPMSVSGARCRGSGRPRLGPACEMMIRSDKENDQDDGE